MLILPISWFIKKPTSIQQKITKTETDSGLAFVLNVANLVESDAKDLSKNNFGNLLNKTIRCNDGGSNLQQLWVEITKFLHVLSEKYSSVYMCDSSAVHYPSVFHSASNDASEFPNLTSQASSHTDNTVDSVWQPSEKESSCSTESTSKCSCDVCQNDKMSVDTDSLVSENLTCSNTSMRKISKDDSKDNGCDGKPPFLCKFQISIFGNYSIYENFPGSYS
jgi:hypothetical protein